MESVCTLRTIATAAAAGLTTPAIDAQDFTTNHSAGPRPGGTKLATSTSKSILAFACASALLLVAALPARSQETVLYSFTGGNDGAGPVYGVTFDNAGNIYSTTYSGGKYQDGTVFELIAHSSGKYSERVLHAFRGGDGLNPFSGVIFDSAGDLFGSTAYGGDNQCSNAPGCGVVYELTPNSSGSYTDKTLVHFHGTPLDGPYSNFVMDGQGDLYGVATGYNTYSSGEVYEVIR